MLQVAWRTWGHGGDRVTEPKALLLSELVQPLARAGHKSPFEVTFLLPYRGAVIAPSCPRRDRSHRASCAEQMLLMGLWGHPPWWPLCVQGTEQHCSSCKSCFPSWPWGSDPTAAHRQWALSWAVGSCSLVSCTQGTLWVLLTQCISSGTASVPLLAGALTAQVPLATGHQEALQKTALSLPAPAVAPHGKPSLSPAGNWLFPVLHFSPAG